MKKNIIKYFLLVTCSFVFVIIYLSVIGVETEKFNNQIKDKVFKNNNNLKIDLKKIKLTLDPFNFRINAKTIGANILYRGKNLELEYIKTKISLISLIKNKFVSSSIELSTKSILLKDLVTFIRVTLDRPELFILETVIKKGKVIADIEFNFDKNGEIKQDYKINGILKDGKIKLIKDYNFEKINFLLNVSNNILNFRDISFTSNKIDFFSDNLKITRNKKNFFFEGEIQNENSNPDKTLFKLFNLKSKNLNFQNINFTSKNKFSFNINNKLKIKNPTIDSEILVSKSEYKKPPLFRGYLLEENDLIHIKDHRIKIKYKKNDFTMEGFGKIKFDKKFEEIKYKINNKEKDLKLFSNILLSELNFKNHGILKNFFPKLNKVVELKNHQIEINYHKDNISIKGSGKIKLEKNFDEINFYISKIKDKINFDTKIDLLKTSFNFIFLNFKKNEKLKTQIKIIGSYNKKKELNFNEISIIEKNNKIVFENILLDKNNQIIKVDKINLNYFDIKQKKNQLLFLREGENNYEITGPLFNANRLINNLLNSKSNVEPKIFKNDINLSLNLKKVFISNEDIVSNLKGKLHIRNNKIFKADIVGSFDKNENLTFTVNTNNSGNKITTLFSSRAKPIVKKYKFIKGYEEGYLDFYSSKKNNISTSKLKIFNFKLQELPTLTKLLTLASLRGIADILSGEGIRFNEFEMNFKNKGNIMTIDEIYAIGPAISILMSGYVEENKLVSLRGTLVPATTINKTIGSIPFLGKILVGDKAGEGVFGVSFKIKGPLKNLETTVNPIRTLTPRFITRTLERIKKN